MKTRDFAAATASLAILLTSCGSDIEPKQGDVYDPSVISFNVVADRATRGEVTTTANIKEFAVTAYTEGKTLMDNVKVTRDGTSWSYTPTAYWPDTPVNFFAISPDISGSSAITEASTGTASISGYKNPGNVDLLYAVNMGAIQSGSPVSLNFRHALSKVNVLLSSSNSSLTVKVNKVMIGNVYSTGSFYYPRATTSAGGEAAGTWHSLTGMIDVSLYAPTATQGTQQLTPEPTDISANEGGSGYDFFMPQTLGKLTYDSANKIFTGTYIAVDCEVFDKATGSKLFPNAETPSYLLVDGKDSGRIMYPVTNSTVTEWKAGYSYVYRIAIDNPAVLLDSIKFDVTVDEYQNGSMTETPGM